MKKILSLLALLMLCVVGVNADTTVKYALAEGDAFTSGQSVEVKNGDEVVATIVYGESGGADFKAAKAADNIEGYTAFTEGNGTNGNKEGGTFYTITPNVDATIAVAVVLNADKAFYVEEDGTALDAYNGIKVTEKYYGTYEFEATAGKAYKVYCAGSKLGFFGFEMTIAGEEPAPVVVNKTIGLIPGVWNADGATFAAYAFNSDEDNAWFPFVEASGAYATQIPDSYAKIIAVRLKPATVEGFDAGNYGLNWANKWNQTADIDFTKVADGSVITITGWETADYTITNALQDAKDLLTKAIALAEMVDAEGLADQIAAGKTALAGEDITAMQNALNAIISAAAPKAQTLLTEVGEFAEKYGYTAVAEAVNAVKAQIPSEGATPDLAALLSAVDKLKEVALPAAEDAVGKIDTYAKALNDETLNTAIANAKTALATKSIKNIIAAVKAAEEPFKNAASAFVAKVQAENIQDANVQTALAAVVAAMRAENPSIVAIGDAVKNLIDAYNAYQLEQNPVYTVAGTEDLTGYDWDATKNEMKLNEETGLYEWTAKFITVNATKVPAFKVVRNANWDTCWPEGDNWFITPDYLGGEGIYTITITFNAETKEIGVTGVKRAEPVYAENNVYFWESPDGYVDENGGTAVHNNGGRVNYAQAGYYTISLNGKSDFSTDIVTITLNEGVTLKAGDEIAITAFRNKDATGKTSGALLKFDDGNTINTGDGTEFVNLNTAVAGSDEYATEPNTIIIVVPETAEGSKTIQMTRSKTETNLFITKIEINRPEPFNPIELCEITPAPGIYDALPTEWVLTYGGKKLSVNEDAEVKLTQGETEYPLYIMLDEEDDTKAIIAFDGRPINTPGEWLIEIPENTITVDGVTIADPQSFKYTVKNPVDFTVDPAEGEYASLSTFTITANNIASLEIDEDKVSVFLFNRETEQEIQPTYVDVIGSNKIYIMFDEVTTAGEWQLNVLDGFKSTLTGENIPELFFEYTIAAPAAPDYYLVGTMNGWTQSESYKLEANPATDGEYMITLNLEANAAFKINTGQGEETIWYPAGTDNDYVVENEGNYTVYFRPDGQGDSSWHYGVIYVQYNGESTGINGIAAEKLNGAVIYNLNGQRVQNAQKGLYIVNGRKVVIK
ncbi:MAG: hypothetical protein IJ200_04120 [Prevotella sp.]|nr:hypothetical protein [Prevotella sp.]